MVTCLTSVLLSSCTGVLGGTQLEEDQNNPSILPTDPGSKGIHRLNTAEYNATVADVLGSSLMPATANWRGGELDGFDNMASVLGIDANQYERYLNAAEDLVVELLSNTVMRDKLIPCATPDDSACVQNILETAGLRIFRRPLEADEIGTYAKVYEASRDLGDEHYDAAGLMIQALLSSAEFLYRIEIDPDLSETEAHPLTSFELASRLSYFLWSSAPDDELLASAANASLLEEEVLRETVSSMLASEKSERFVRNFAGQWLGARQVLGHPTDPEVYPGWNADIAKAASEEIYLYFNEFLRSERSYLEFLQADLNFVDAALAGHYGMAPPSAGTERRENVEDERSGFLGLAGFLAVSSFARRTSPTLRGKWVLLNLMCTHPPPPPAGADIAELDEQDQSETQNIRDKLEQHRADPGCAGCHAMFDPFGLALEEFDGIGNFRTAYPDDQPINANTDLFGEAFSGLQGTADIVTAQPEFGPCVAEKMLAYGLGRPITEEDRPYLKQVTDAWLASDDTPTLSRAIERLVLTDTFRKRRAEAEGELP